MSFVIAENCSKEGGFCLGCLIYGKQKNGCKKESSLTFSKLCGEKGIRTLGPPKEVNGFRDRPDRPLRHLSISFALTCVVQYFSLENVCKNTNFFSITKKKRIFAFSKCTF